MAACQRPSARGVTPPTPIGSMHKDASNGRACTLAYHYAEAIDPEIADLAWRDHDQDAARPRASALRWLRRAAELALARFDLDDALGLLERAAELTPDNPDCYRIRSPASTPSSSTARPSGSRCRRHSSSPPTSLSAVSSTPSCPGFESTMRGAMWKVAPGDWAIVSGWIGGGARALPAGQPPVRTRMAWLGRRCSRTTSPRPSSRSRSPSGSTTSSCSPSVSWRAPPTFSQQPTSRPPPSWRSGGSGSSRGSTVRTTSPRSTGAQRPRKLGLGRLEDAEHHALRHAAIAARLTSHHEVHAIGDLVTLDEAAGRWDRLHQRTEWSERAVAANADTPCVYNPRNLLASAVACAALGLDDEARRLEAEESALGFKSWGCRSIRCGRGSR